MDAVERLVATGRVHCRVYTVHGHGVIDRSLLQHWHWDRERGAVYSAEDKARRLTLPGHMDKERRAAVTVEAKTRRLQQQRQRDRERRAAVTVEDKARKLHFDTIQQSLLPSLEQSLGCRKHLQLQHTT